MRFTVWLVETGTIPGNLWALCPSSVQVVPSLTLGNFQENIYWSWLSWIVEGGSSKSLTFSLCADLPFLLPLPCALNPSLSLWTFSSVSSWLILVSQDSSLCSVAWEVSQGSNLGQQLSEAIVCFYSVSWGGKVNKVPVTQM